MNAAQILSALVAILMLTDGGIGAVPSGILVAISAKAEGPSRIELTGEKAAFHNDGRDLVAGTVTESNDILRVEFPDLKSAIVLVQQGDEWIDQDKDRWVRRESLVKFDPAWKPVRVTAVDQNKTPLKKFGYRYEFEWKGGNWDPMLVRPLPVEDGVITLQCPAECAISLSIDHPDFGRGYGSGRTLDRKSDSKELRAEFKRGRKVVGKVVADETGKPVAGAIVSPSIFTPPGFQADHGRAVETGADGSFELRGVDSEFKVNHADFVAQSTFLDEKNAVKPYVVRLKAGQTIIGIVRDSGGNNLAGVFVDDGSGKTTETGKDGRFTLRGLRKWNGDDWHLTFSKDGFNNLDFRRPKIPPQGLEIKLLPLPEFRGRVASTNGTPVKNFKVVCGPGADPRDYECAMLATEDEEGRFLIRPEKISGTGTYWLGVKADGFAPWDGLVTLSKLTSGDFNIVLKAGATLSATVALPESARGPIEVRLEPTDRQPSETVTVTDHPGKTLAKHRFPLKRGENLSIPHLRAGEYMLEIVSLGATPMRRPFRIGSEDLNLGTLPLAGTGSLFGTVTDPDQNSELWRFADGQIFIDGFGGDRFEPYLKFKADEMGRFRVDGVPTGIVTVSFPYHMTADIIGSLTRTAKVADGKLTEVRFEGERGAWAQPLRLLFDGKDRIPAYKGIRKVENVTEREAMFRIEVVDMGAGTSSCDSSTGWSGGKSRPVIPDLSPGRWRIRIFDWLGSTGFDQGLRSEVVADVGEERKPITIELGDRALSGRVTASRETKRHVQIIAVGKNSNRVFLSRCDGEGNFVVRFIPKDEYLVHAHDDDGGWCELGSFNLDKAVADCGEHALSIGGSVTGTLAGNLRSPKGELHLAASSTDGVEIPVDEVNANGSYRFGNLRPGKWTIVVRLDDKELSRHSVDIQKGKSVKVD